MPTSLYLLGHGRYFGISFVRPKAIGFGGTSGHTAQCMALSYLRTLSLSYLLLLIFQTKLKIAKINRTAVARSLTGGAVFYFLVLLAKTNRSAVHDAENAGFDQSNVHCVLPILGLMHRV